ncbi:MULTISPECIES: hypothetical protein [unclassified Streptomyces]|uniref:hypothetical protein n=1 Tax=unclassified Streptomyces TaxID=2593676 RepID=UPI001F0791DF|nr:MULTISPECIES: hypothetical protein [unclassified Streptomyces]
MVLDNWGRVETWTATAPVTSHGPSGIGFVNFGDVDRLDVQAPITTHGTGARGFNLYDGSLRTLRSTPSPPRATARSASRSPKRCRNWRSAET